MGKTVETVTNFIFGGSKITADGDCSHDIKRCLPHSRKVMTNLGSTLKSRDITLSTKVHLVKVMVFPVVMYEYESWIVKKTESWRIYAFELWCWRRFLRVPWTARRSNHSILKEISPEYSWKDWCRSRKFNTLATLYEGLTHLKRPWCWERQKAGEGDDRGWEGWMASPTQWTWVWVKPRSWWWIGRPGFLQSMGLQRIGYNWTELNLTRMLQKLVYSSWHLVRTLLSVSYYQASIFKRLNKVGISYIMENSHLTLEVLCHFASITPLVFKESNYWRNNFISFVKMASEERVWIVMYVSVLGEDVRD